MANLPLLFFSAAATAEVISNEEQATFTAAVIISMLFSPIIAQIARKLIQRTEPKHLDQLDENDLDTIGDLEDNVLVIGFGRFSQIVC